MNRLSRYTAAALVASLTMSAAAYAAVPSTGFAPSSARAHQASMLADASIPDMDIRLLCHEHSRQGWPCGAQDVLAACDSAYRTCGLDNGVGNP